jgi:hypothetical protein
MEIERDHMGYQGVDGKTLLKCHEETGVGCENETAFISRDIGTTGGLL